MSRRPDEARAAETPPAAAGPQDDADGAAKTLLHGLLPLPDARLPSGIFRYVLATSLVHQLALAVMTVVAFLLELVPLELQRRIIDDIVKQREYELVIVLGGVYAAVVFLQGGVKFLVNVYRGWVGERAVRDLRNRVRFFAEMPANDAEEAKADDGDAPKADNAGGTEGAGVQAAMIVAEVEPVGGFVGEAVSEPLLQAGVMASTFAYMIHVEPWMALAAGALFLPQFVFVPLLQHWINRLTNVRIRLLRKVSTSVMQNDNAEGAENGREHPDEARIAVVFRLNMAVYWLRYGMNFLMNFCNHLQIVSALLIGGWFVLHNQLELGGVVAFISGLAKLKDPWDELVDYFRNLTVTQVKFRLIANTYNRLLAGADSPTAPNGGDKAEERLTGTRGARPGG